MNNLSRVTNLLRTHHRRPEELAPDPNFLKKKTCTTTPSDKGPGKHTGNNKKKKWRGQVPFPRNCGTTHKPILS
ncbi:hypothetical protein RIR_jg24342.t1 [Rhizophagus irregularis DAOM 181602=DAOM 197198]|nr:hypothetical protein RIR_jg24342.t1 [Rhizophagus irregularis DAOM 181602=DAOM 197198]